MENKVEFLERQFHSEKLSFVHKKETEHSFELSLSICVFYRRIFNLEMQSFSLENHQIMIPYFVKDVSLILKYFY